MRDRLYIGRHGLDGVTGGEVGGGGVCERPDSQDERSCAR